MMQVLIDIGWVVAAFLTMEGVAWLAHRYLMHGWLWHLHVDHHQPRQGHRFERNDLFFVIFAVPAIACFIAGFPELTAPFWIATGISLYGLAYFLVHDLFIHQRAKIFRNANSRYFRAIRRAHKMHHKHLGPEEGECFGMLLPPLKYFRDAKEHAG